MRTPALRIHSDEIVVDCFAGGGGASLGISWALGRHPDIAINHDPAALAMHAANHPTTKHLCENVWAVDPIVACGGRPVGLLWASPDCTHHSKAKGGKPRSKKLRALIGDAEGFLGTDLKCTWRPQKGDVSIDKIREHLGWSEEDLDKFRGEESRVLRVAELSKKEKAHVATIRNLTAAE